MDIKYPWQVEAIEWRSKVGALDTMKIGPMLAKFEEAFDELPEHLYDTDGLDDVEAARDRLEQALGTGAKAAKAFSDQGRAIASAIDKLLGSIKKDGKNRDAVKFASDAADMAEKLGKELVKLSAESALAIKKVCARFESDEKKGADKDKDKDAGPNPKLLAHNSKVRGVVNKLRGGTQPRTPFAFLQCKVRKPFDKSKPWDKKSLMHVGPKALKSCRSELEKLLLPEQRSGEFVFFFGEVELQGPKGKGKLVFEFESAPANPKQMKDALLFQCRYSPPFLVRKKGSAEVQEEAAEGDEKDAEGDDDDSAAEPAAKPAAWVSAKPSAVQDAEIAKVRTALVGAHGNLRKGIGSLMTRVTSAYRGASGADAESVKTALRRLDALRKKLDIDVDAPLAAIAKAKDASDRAKRRKAALDKVSALAEVVARDELMDDLDRNELMPSLAVVAPMRDALKKAIGALR